VTWQDSRQFVRVARGETQGVLHLHGHYQWPDSVVLGTADYANIMGNGRTQAIQQALTTLRTMLLVGVGDGVDDPNFAALRDWMRRIFEHSGHSHYRLCRDGELEKLRAEHGTPPATSAAASARATESSSTTRPAGPGRPPG
jgi:SIR2-like domain